jgi:hypothetical protein
MRRAQFRQPHVADMRPEALGGDPLVLGPGVRRELATSDGEPVLEQLCHRDPRRHGRAAFSGELQLVA